MGGYRGVEKRSLARVREENKGEETVGGFEKIF